MKKAAHFSGSVFTRMLSKFDVWRRKYAMSNNLGMRRIHLLAHSMSNRVHRTPISYCGKYDHHGHQTHDSPLVTVDSLPYRTHLSSQLYKPVMSSVQFCPNFWILS